MKFCLQAVSNPPQRMLFAGTDNGVVRSFKFPLTGDVRDYQCHAASISRIRMSVDDLYLFTVGEDGCLAVFNIQEKDGRGKRDRVDAVPFAEEILVTKSDLEEKTSLMNELKSKVDELTASNEYQLRLHDMNYQEKLKEVSEKYNFQIQHDKGKIEMLRDEKQELEMEFDEKVSDSFMHTNHSLVVVTRVVWAFCFKCRLGNCRQVILIVFTNKTWSTKK